VTQTGQPAVNQTGKQPAANPPLPTIDEDVGESRETEAIPVDLFQRGMGCANDTLRKNWQSANGLDAQLITNPVYLVAGERIRIPVSVRNQDTAPMTLRLHVAGLPQDWQVGADDVIHLAPGEIRSAGIVLQTQPSFMQSSVEAVIRISDQERPERFLMLPLNLIFKSAPNLVGKLSPERVAAPGTVYLTLHNHTQVPVTAFLTGHSPSADVRISPAQPQAQIPPGQFLEIPVRAEGLRRRWFGARHPGLPRHGAGAPAHSAAAAGAAPAADCGGHRVPDAPQQPATGQRALDQHRCAEPDRFSSIEHRPAGEPGRCHRSTSHSAAGVQRDAG
jgi:hypothetical protein